MLNCSNLIVDLLSFVEKKSLSSIFDNHNISEILTHAKNGIDWEQALALINQAGVIFKEKTDIDEFTMFLLSSKSMFGKTTVPITSKIFNSRLLYDVFINFICRNQIPSAEFATDFGGKELLVSLKSPEKPGSTDILFILLKSYLELLPTTTGAARAAVDLSFTSNHHLFRIKPPAEKNFFKSAVRFIKDYLYKNALIKELISPDTHYSRTFRDLALRHRSLTQTLGQCGAEIKTAKNSLNKAITELEEIELTLGSGTWTINVTSKQVLLSKNAARLFGLSGSAAETSLTNFIACIHPEDRLEFEIAFLKLKKDGLDLSLELRVLTKDGERILQQRGKLEGPIVIGRIVDVTIWRKNESRLAQELELAQEASRHRNQFLANMSHEIRTPLTSVLGFAELIINPKTNPEKTIAYVETIKRNGKMLLAVIDDILDLSTIEAGYLQLNVGEFELKSLVENALTKVKVIADRKNVVLNTIYYELPDSLPTDIDRFSQVIGNIIGQSLEMSMPGEITLSVRSIVKDSRNVGVELYLEDREKLISPDFFQILFDPFNTFEPEKQRQKASTRLAITLARTLLHSMEGSVLRKVGNDFALSLFPIKAMKNPTAPFFPRNLDATTSDLAANTSPLLQARILITEDNKDIQEIVSKILQEAGAITLVANNGVECLEMMEKNEFDMILMDLQMPVMDGFETTERLRAKGYNLPIIVITAYALNDERERCLKAGCTDFVTKPINREVLLKNLLRNRS